ncbi:hypothetical protein QQZ08_011003 [Neonectria magnoliae]|uniref:C2H2-type domain-containing protein n=1 Tax=Neonectria magnoliae TaxID=2732573 RepID=A0ABR1HDB6_9HYPO
MAILLVDSDSNGLVQANVAPMDAPPGDNAFGSVANAERTAKPRSSTSKAWFKLVLSSKEEDAAFEIPQSQPPPVSEGINNTNRSPSQGQDTKTLAQAATLLLDSAQLSADATTLFKTSSTPTPQSMQQPLPLVDLTQFPSSRSEVLLSPEAHAQDGTAGISIHDDKFGASKTAVQPPTEKKNYTCKDMGCEEGEILNVSNQPFCPTCHCAFESNQTLTRHMRTHKKERETVQCICGESFTRKDNLKTHSKFCKKAQAQRESTDGSSDETDKMTDSDFDSEGSETDDDSDFNSEGSETDDEMSS